MPSPLDLQSVFDMAPQPSVLADAHLRVLAVNQALVALSGFATDDLLEAPLAQLLAPSEGLRLGALCDRGPGPHFLVAQGRRASGEEYRAELRLKRLLIEDQELWMVTLADVTANLEALEALRRSEAEYRRMVEASPDGVALLVEGKVVFANGALENLLGLSGPDELWGSEIEALIHPDDQDAWREGIFRVLAGQTLAPQELRAVKPGGSLAELEVARLRLQRPDGPAILVLARDAKGRREIERRLKESEERYKGLAAVAFDGVAIHLDGTILSVNHSFEAIFGRAEGDLLGTDLFHLFSVPDQALFRSELDSGKVLELQGSQPSGQSVFVEASSQACLYENEPAYVTAVRDVTRRRLAEDKVRRQAWHDALTGLPNRVLLLDRLNQSLKQAELRSQRLALLFLDLDRFKLVNDSLGHQAGDDLLKQTASRLQALLSPEDTVARLGGDEFCILLADLSGDRDVMALGQRIVAALHEPFTVQGQQAYIGTSVGVAFYPEHGLDPERLLKVADMAMYRAKKNGRNQVALYAESLEQRQEKRLGLENELRRAIDRSEFKLHYQPQVELATGRIIGAEALLRWLHPQRGLLSPDEFIPLAEESRLIEPLGEWVLFQTCAKAAGWNKQNLAGNPLSIAINLSAWQLHKHSFIKTVDAVLAKSGLSPELLELEITETVAMRNPSLSQALFSDFAARGVRLSLDDFGKGYSSLSYLKQFPVHSIKVDQSFVAGLPGAPKDVAIVKAVVTLAHDLGLRCLAEGIENQVQLDHLKQLGCDYGQGYFFSRPLPEEAFEALLAKGLNLL